MNERHFSLQLEDSAFRSEQGARLQPNLPDPKHRIGYLLDHSDPDPAEGARSCTDPMPSSCDINQAHPALAVHDATDTVRRGKQHNIVAAPDNGQLQSGHATSASAPPPPELPTAELQPRMRPEPALGPEPSDAEDSQPGANRPTAADRPAAADRQGAAPAAALPGAGLWPLPEPAEPLPLNLTRHIMLSPADPFHNDWAFW